MKILSNKRYKQLLDYESKYKALLSMEKEEIVHRYFDLYSVYIQLLKRMLK